MLYKIMNLLNIIRHKKDVKFLPELSLENSKIKFLAAINILKTGYGLKKSMIENRCIDIHGNAIPWYTYPAIEYIKQLDFSNKKIFEFGSGNSSLYWSSVAKEVVSIEDNEDWYKSIAKFKRKNLKLIHIKLGNNYFKSILKEKNNFDVIIIDGKLREKCCKSALKKIAKNGIIILDNSERAASYVEYRNAVKILRDADLIQVDFCGFGPINEYTWATSIFFKRKFDFKSKYYPIQPYNIIGQIK